MRKFKDILEYDNIMKGKFIVFEGIDGCGKGTQMKLAASYIFEKSKDFDLYLTREPTRDFKEIRQKLAQGTDAKQDAEWYLNAFLEDRKNHLTKYIIPAMNNGLIILCDRYKHSTHAYQHTQGIDLDRIINLHQGLLIPDLTLIFDCPADVAFERRKNAGATEVFDKDLSFQEELRNNYLKLKDKLIDENIVIIDATKSPKEVFEEVKNHITRIL